MLRALATALALAGCAGGGPMPEPVAAPPAGTLAPAAPLAATVWKAEGRERAVLLAVHGFGDHAESAFGEAAPVWAAAGITVIAYDQRGFGRNPSRGAWPGAGALIGDFAAAARAAAAAHPDAPLIALGHSMGGGVAVAAIGEGRAPDVDALALVAPAIAGGDEVAAPARLVAAGFAAVVPDRRWTGEGVVEVRATDNEAWLRRLAADPLYVQGATAREIAGLIDVLDRAAAAAPGVTVPTLVLLGGKDEVTPRAPIGRTAQRFGGPVEIRTYPEGWHILLGDLQRALVVEDLRDWMLERAP